MVVTLEAGEIYTFINVTVIGSNITQAAGSALRKQYSDVFWQYTLLKTDKNYIIKSWQSKRTQHSMDSMEIITAFNIAK
ncbi:MAG: hypothetical protein COA58_15440 [Bacteroidetes bacterium]|nr:MAG: hypothetical protein COA58_15440 [Bacteroidota bacterium]